MSAKTPDDIRTLAYVLRRTNYGEADRILNLLTPTGQYSAIARGVRKEKSRLKSSIEMFSLIDINLHVGKGELYTVTSAKMLDFYSNLLTDLSRLELASLILKKVNSVSGDANSEELFNVVDQSLKALNAGENPELIEAWFWLNFAKAKGEEINLYRDTSGEKLVEDGMYIWNTAESALEVYPGGNIGASEIKLMRLMLTSRLNLALKVRNAPPLEAISYIAKAINKLWYNTFIKGVRKCLIMVKKVKNQSSSQLLLY